MPDALGSLGLVFGEGAMLVCWEKVLSGHVGFGVR